MNDDLYWTPAKLATLVEQVPTSDASADAAGWSRFDFHAFLGNECEHGVPRHSTRLVGTWPIAPGSAPPLLIAQRLSDMMCAYQRAHAEAMGGPGDGIALYIRRRDGLWELAWGSS